MQNSKPLTETTLLLPLNVQNLKSIVNQINSNDSIIAYFENAIKYGFQQNLFELLDNYLFDLIEENDHKINTLFVRVLSLSSQFNKLCQKSETNDIRKSCNEMTYENNSFISNTIQCFECLDFEFGVKNIIKLRNEFGFGNQIISDLYDSCVNVLIKHCVKTVFNFITTEESGTQKEIPLEQWVVANCSARIDLQGGWTDTPPICYESGGQVLNIAIKVNNRKPIGAKARKIKLNDHNLISIKEYDFNKKLLTNLNLNSVEDFENYGTPNSSGALVKAALICSGIVDINKTNDNLYNQLKTNLNSGLEIELWSDLPQGSGLGTSSILSGCVIAVLWTLFGKSFTRTSLIHAVLYSEQLLTTGGGWQDQIGGIIGGVKLGTSQNSLPLRVEFKTIAMSSSFRSLFEKHLMLIYSGTVRLAKDLLQNVIHNWYIQEKQIIDCFRELTLNASLSYNAFLKEDIKTIGSLLSRYWQQKQILAPNSEPKNVSQFLNCVEPYIYGGSLAGAGGGGFLCLIIKDESFRDQINAFAQQYLPESQTYECEVDVNGLELLINDNKHDIPFE